MQLRQLNDVRKEIRHVVMHYLCNFKILKGLAANWQTYKSYFIIEIYNKLSKYL